ncbi:MAG: 2-phospho-L-lactate guanylyltransferase, partial [Methanosphaera sp.]|nr:2-phospho-L-lactate guanylyltransferase [Methanosphaera sp.]
LYSLSINMNNLITIIPISNFHESKTRLSPFLDTDERIQLLKCMLKDITDSINNRVKDIVVTSNDEDVLEYARSLNITGINEKKHTSNFLNNALLDAIEYVKNNYDNPNIMILPADIPLINKENIQYIHDNMNNFIITPSMGGGTNLLYINNNYGFTPLFGEFSYFKHIEEAKEHELTVNVYDSFFLSLDVNTPQDLGEILLHGSNSATCEYLNSIGIHVENKHCQERLHVYRE